MAADHGADRTSLLTRLPVQLVLGSETQTYTFLTPPTGPPAIPANVLQAAQERGQRVREIMDAFPRRR
jgi:hypothetical protein